MFYFNPISYFIKTFIMLFTRKFFWVILILFCLALGFIVFSPEVKAVSSFTFDDSSFTDSDINVATSKIGSSIWNNDSYDIFLFYNSGPSAQKCVLVYDTSNLPDNCVYKLFSTGNVHYNYNTYAYYFMYSGTEDKVDTITTDYKVRSLYNSYTEDWSTFPPSEYPNAGITFFGQNDNLIVKVIRSHFNFVDSNNEIIYSATNPRFTAPYIVNSTEVANWSFDTLNISLGSVIYNSDNSYYLNYNISSVDYGLELRNYYNEELGYFVVPRNQLTNNVVLRDNDTLSFSLVYRSLGTVTPYELGNFTLALTSAEQEQVNQDSDKYVQGQILEQQQQTNDKLDETNDKLDDLQNTITDTTVPADTEFDLPTIEVNDTTSNFFDTLFTGIYNAFNINEDITISFTIFSKTITINSGDFRMLNDSNFNVLRLLLESSWYFAIGYMVLKDIRLIFDKIKNGNIENAVSNDIKADMV